MCWRLGTSMLKASLRQECPKCKHKQGAEHAKCKKCSGDMAGSKTVSTSHYGQHYLDQKSVLEQRLRNEGVQIVPTIKLPKKNGKYYEPEGMISEGHVHGMALRKMIKLFLSNLWLVWREALKLPITKPYAHEKLGHTHIINAWDMCDRPAKKMAA